MHQNMWNVCGKCFKVSTQRFCIGTNKAHSVKEFVEEAFTYMDWNEYVKIDPKYFRLTEAEILVADPANVIKKLGLSPKIKFGDLLKIMIDVDMRAVGLEHVGEGDELLKKRFLNK